MGRGRKSVIVQGNSKKKKKECGPLPMGERRNMCVGLKPANQTIVDIPEELLNAFRKMNPRDIVNIIVDP